MTKDEAMKRVARRAKNVATSINSAVGLGNDIRDVAIAFAGQFSHETLGLLLAEWMRRKQRREPAVPPDHLPTE